MATAETPNYLDPKVLERIKRLDVRARLVVEGFITGQHKSPYNGFAIEFASHREYVPGDEIKHIDWKVWSKTDRLYIKEYEEETNLKTTLIIDCSKSMAYARDGWRKFDYAATAGASLAHLLQHQGDAVGMITFNTEVKDVLPPSARSNHLKEMVHVLGETEPDDKTDVGDVFLELVPQLRTRGMVVIISDLFAPVDTIRQSLQQHAMPFFTFFQLFFGFLSLGDVVGDVNHLTEGAVFVLNRKGRYFHNDFMTITTFVDVFDSAFLAGLFGFEHGAFVLGRRTQF